MFTNNGAAKNSAGGKRKMKEVATETVGHSNHHPHGSGPPPRRMQVQQILNTAAPQKPFSFTSLLTSDEGPNSVIPYTRNHTEEVEQLIFLHCENLRQALRGTIGTHNQKINRWVEEKAAKKLKEKESELQQKTARNIELERLATLYKSEAERLLNRSRQLETMNISLRASLQEANEARRLAETEQEDESSFEDPDRVGPVRLDCKVCQRQLATVLIWPCRHLCICTGCQAVTKLCPVCCGLKTNSVEICLPL
ncbi:hypothetical protein ABFS83_06G055100 [Erythranthe nasuta]